MNTVKSEVNVKWIESTLMLGVDSKGQSVVVGKNIDVEPEIIGSKASDLLLLAASTCSMYDVIVILQKQKQPLEDINIICSGGAIRGTTPQFHVNSPALCDYWRYRSG